MRHLRSIFLAFLLFNLGGCGLNPATKRPEPVLISTGMEEKLGAEQHRLVETEIGLENDPELTEYVRRIGHRLAVHSPRRDITYRFYVVDMPDVRGRLGILKVHARPIPLDENVELEKIARGTPGFSGADLANIMNEAALLAARRNRDKVMMIDLLDAKFLASRLQGFLEDREPF